MNSIEIENTIAKANSATSLVTSVGTLSMLVALVVIKSLTLSRRLSWLYLIPLFVVS